MDVKLCECNAVTHFFADVFEAAVTLESAAVPLLYPTVDSRIARLTAAVPTGGVIEFQLDFPSSESCTASDQVPPSHIFCLIHVLTRPCCTGCVL